MANQNMQKFREAKEAAESQGWVVESTKKHHWKFKAPNNGVLITVSGTPSDHRAFKNFIAQMRRGGLRLKK